MKTNLFKKSIILSLILLLIPGLTNAQSVRINEFMALNQSILMDEDGDFSDWIELYNYGTTPVNLQTWGLSDDVTQPFKWVFPDVTLNQGEYLIVFCSSKDRDLSDGELHTNFNLSGSGEYLALSDGLGNPLTTFDPSYPEQNTDYSFGFYEDEYVEFSVPTPGEENNSSTGANIPAPEFDTKHGFFEAPFNLTITNPLVGAKTYYTTNGSTPTKSNGTLYQGAINITTTSVVRTISVFEGSGEDIISPVATQTYLFLDDVIKQNNSPEDYPSRWGPYTAISGFANADYEMDPVVMNDPGKAAEVKQALLELPTISLVTDIPNFFSDKEDEETGGIYIYTGAPLDHYTYGPGRGWERPVSFEYFDNSGKSLQENCGIRLQGGHSRRAEKNPKHSFQLVFKSEYGASKLDYPLFGEDAAQKHDRVILRAGFGNSWLHHGHDQRSVATYQEDIWTKDTQRAMGHPSSRSNYAHLYINGIYWGIYAPSERMDAEFGESYMGGNEEEYDVIKDYTEVSDGTIDAWDDMMRFVERGLSSETAYQRLQGNNPDGTPNPLYPGMVDVVNLADYMLINFYGGNSDWDHHNWAAMRNRVNPDKGFKFLCWDAEIMFGSVNANGLGEDNANCPSRIYQRLLENDSFKRLLADRIQKHCFNGGMLTPEAAEARWLERRSQIEGAVNAESARWGDYRKDVHRWQTSGPFYLYGKDNFWLPRQEYMLNDYFPRRTDRFVQNYINEGIFPNIDAPILFINGEEAISEVIETGDELSMTSSDGTIYYTLDGSEPVVFSDEDNSGSTITLFSESDLKRVMVPKANIGTSWYSNVDYDDSTWKQVNGLPGGVGYERNSGYENLISLDVTNDMHSTGSNPNTSCYVRIPFDVSSVELSNIASLSLNLRYDDGFVAYLNGTKIAETNTPGNVTWNSEATDNHEAGSPEAFNISFMKSALVSGKNVIAIHVLNRNIGSSDFLLNASLTASDAPSGAVFSDNALEYNGPITLNNSVRVIARTFNGSMWSARSDKFFGIPSDYEDLKITEIHYNPLAEGDVDGSEFEFIELKNTGESTLNLSDISFVDGIDFTFPKETQLGAGEFIVLAANHDQFYDRYSQLAWGQYSGKLDNNGERLIVSTPSNDTIINFRYNDAGDWPQEPDGEGYSLVPELYNPTGDQSDPATWRASYELGGSPAKDDLPPSALPIVDGNKNNGVLLSQNYPNPTNGNTFINYQLPYNATVKLSVYNVMGKEIAQLVNATQLPGLYQVQWSGANQPNGIYFYRITVIGKSRSETLSKSMILKK